MQTHAFEINWKSGNVVQSNDSRRLYFCSNPGVRIINLLNYKMEVYPSEMIARHMKETVESDDMEVSFIANIAFIKGENPEPYELKLKSGRNGVYAHETIFPKEMICSRDTPEQTVLASLNNAWNLLHWYPEY